MPALLWPRALGMPGIPAIPLPSASATAGLQAKAEASDFSKKISGWKKMTCPGTHKLRSSILCVAFPPNPRGMNFLFGRMLSDTGITTVPVFEMMSREDFCL